MTSTKAIACDLTDPRAPLAAAYDRVLLDAPCSGLGVLRRHPEAKWRRAPADAAPLAALQASSSPRWRRACARAACSSTRCAPTPTRRGRSQLERFLAAHADFRVDPDVAGGAPVRTWPHRDDADGFFAVRLVRAVQ